MERIESTGDYQADFGGGLLTVEVGIGLTEAPGDEWCVWEDGGAGAEIVSTHGTREEAQEAADEYHQDADETPNIDDLIQQIEDTGYFEHPEVIPDVIDGCCGYEQGVMLITPNICRPVGSRWVTSGWLECEHISLPATYPSREQAAEALLEILEADKEEED